MGADNPLEWARKKRRKLERYARPDFLDVVRAARDVCLPGVPLCVLLGFAANGSRNENTTGWIAGDAAELAAAERQGKTPLGRALDSYARTGLHELGPFGVEAGRAPTPVATASDCPWVSLARSAEVEKILGRRAVTGARWHGAVDDQVAVGVANLGRHEDGARGRLHPALGWAADDKRRTLWRLACTMARWSAGGRGIEHINDYAGELAALPEGRRWGRFLELAAAEDDAGAKHRQDEYTALRTAQKLEAARLAAPLTGEGDEALAWLDDGLSADERAAAYARLVDTSLST